MSKRTRDFPLDVMSVASARRFANDVLSDLPRDLLRAVELMVSELATNSVRHARSSFRVTISRAAESVRVEVSDSAGAVMPRMRSPGPEEPTGRGLRIVSLFSDSWGITQSAGSDKSVWFTVVDPQRAAEPEVTGHLARTPDCSAADHTASSARRPPPWRRAAPRRPGSCGREAVRLRRRDRRPRW